MAPPRTGFLVFWFHVWDMLVINFKICPLLGRPVVVEVCLSRSSWLAIPRVTLNAIGRTSCLSRSVYLPLGYKQAQVDKVQTCVQGPGYENNSWRILWKIILLSVKSFQETKLKVSFAEKCYTVTKNLVGKIL